MKNSKCSFIKPVKLNTECLCTQEDLQVVWKRVQYNPGPASIKQQLHDSAKAEIVKLQNKQKKQFMYGLFGSGSGSSNKRRSSGGRCNSYMTRRSEIQESQLTEDTEKVRDSLSPKALRTRVVRHSIREIDILKKVSLMAVDATLLPKKQHAAVANLVMVFEQNRPQPFFGIRKLKMFENMGSDKRGIGSKFMQSGSPDEEQAIDEMLRTKISQIESVRGSFISPGQTQKTAICDDVRERPRVNRLSSYASNTSMATELPSEVGEVLQRLQHITNSDHALGIHSVSDLDSRIGRDRILDLLATKYYRSNHPRRLNECAAVFETPHEATVMRQCVFNNHLLASIVSRRNFFPNRHRAFLQDVDFHVAIISEDDLPMRPTDSSRFRSMNQLSTNRRRVGAYERPKPNSILDEIERDCPDFLCFFRPLMQLWPRHIVENKELINETNPERLNRLVLILGQKLSDTRHTPTSSTRILLQQFLCSGDTNHHLFVELTASIDSWLDQLLKCVMSRFETVRLETFLAITYMLARPTYIAALQNDLFHDALYDMVASILRAIDLKPNDYQMLYSLLGVMWQCAPCQTLLDCLLDRAPYSRHVEMISGWPRLLYMAMHWWPRDRFNNSLLHLQRVIEIVEEHYLRETLCRKTAKQAICVICQRFTGTTSSVITSWPNIDEVFVD